MPLEYVNRRGDRYFVFQGQTKTGKPKYYASKQSSSESGSLLSTLPDDFEVFENPADSTVSVRRRKPSRVLPTERDLVARLALELTAYSCVQTIVDGNRIIVYTPDSDPALAAATLSRIFGSTVPLTASWTQQHTRYNAELRFTLRDADRRTYSAERFCYRSFMNDWIKISGYEALEPLARNLLPHLGRDSFYELI